MEPYAHSHSQSVSVVFWNFYFIDQMKVFLGSKGETFMIRSCRGTSLGVLSWNIWFTVSAIVKDPSDTMFQCPTFRQGEKTV